MKYWQNKKGTVGVDLDQVIGFRCYLDGYDNSLKNIDLYLQYGVHIPFYKSDDIESLHTFLKGKFTT